MTHDKDCSINLDASPRFNCDCSQKTPMTEPQKMGVEEVMGLVTDYFNETCRDMAIGGGDPEQCFDRIKFAVKAIIADRDELALRVKELEKEVMKAWQQDPECNLIYSYCAFCLMGPTHGHEKGCIVLTITNPQA